MPQGEGCPNRLTGRSALLMLLDPRAPGLRRPRRLERASK